MYDLKPCPFCGEKIVKICLEHDRILGRCWLVACQRCGAKSAKIFESISKQEPEEAYEQIERAVNNAVELWNTRAERNDGTA